MRKLLFYLLLVSLALGVGYAGAICPPQGLGPQAVGPTIEADEVAFTPAGDVAATEVQAAIEEVDSEKATKVYTILTDSDIASDTITAAQAKNGVIIFGDKGSAMDYAMPSAAAGLCVWAKATSAHKMTLDSASGDIIILIDGTVLTAAYAIDSDSTNGASIKLIAKDTTYWHVVSQVGAWSDGGAD